MVGLSVRLGVLGVAREQIHQLRVHEEFFPAERLSAQHADRYQRLEIAGSGLATGDFRIDEIRYAAVGLLENDVHQFAAVDLGKSYVAGGYAAVANRSTAFGSAAAADAAARFLGRGSDSRPHPPALRAGQQAAGRSRTGRAILAPAAAPVSGAAISPAGARGGTASGAGA